MLASPWGTGAASRVVVLGREGVRDHLLVECGPRVPASIRLRAILPAAGVGMYVEGKVGARRAERRDDRVRRYSLANVSTVACRDRQNTYLGDAPRVLRMGQAYVSDAV